MDKNKNDINIEEIDMKQIEKVEVNEDGNLDFPVDESEIAEIEYMEGYYAYRRKRTIILVAIILVISILAGYLYINRNNFLKEDTSKFEVPISMSKDLVVTAVGNQMLIRSKWGPVYDLAYEADFGEKVDCGFKIKDIVYIDKMTERTLLPEQTFKFSNLSSSINPISFTKNTSEVIGPKNGWNYAIKVEKSNHGLTEKDIGSVFKDDEGRKFTIVQILNEDSYIIFPSSEDLLKKNYVFNMPDTKLKYVSGYKRFNTLNWSSISKTKLTPAISNLTTSFMADDEKADFSQSNYIICADFEVKISFDILNILSAIKYLESNAGLNRNTSISDKEVGGKYLSVSYSYVFTSNAGCTIINDIECFTDMQITKLYATAVPNFKQRTVYIPNTKLYQNITTMNNSSVEFTKDFWSEETVAPNRVYLFGKKDNSRGVCTGCLTDISNINSAITYDGKHNLIIPNSISKPISATSGTKYQFVNFIIPFEKESKFFQNTNFTSICWFFVDDDIYLLLDAHQPINETVTLPDYMNKMNVENYDLSNGVEVDSITVENNAISFKSTYDYGYAVLKLTR